MIPQEVLDKLPVRCCRICLEAAMRPNVTDIQHAIQEMPDEFYQYYNQILFTHKIVENIPPKKKRSWRFWK